MAEILAVYGGTAPGEPDEEIIARLEDLLAMARDGSLVGFAYVTCGLDGSHGTGWNGVAGTRQRLGAAILMLQHRYARALLDV